MRVLLIALTALVATAGDLRAQLKGPDFFDTANYPEIRFVSRSVREISRGQAEMTGDLTMKAVTRRVRLNVTIRHLEPGTGEPPQRATAARAFVATARLSRSAFNITAMRLLVPDGVDVEVTGILRRAP
jgi:polyisoprenoid-binding protein YceI